VPLRQLRFTGDRGLSAGTAPQAFASNPVIKNFVSKFSKDPHQAISELLSAKKARDDPLALGRLMFHAVELDKVRLGDYLSQRTSKVVLRAYIDSLGLKGLRMDKALRAFFSSMVVPMKSSRDYTVVEYFLDAVASRWYTANTGIVTFDKHLSLRLARALFQLNEVVHVDNGHRESSRRHVSLINFVEAFRQFDDRAIVSDDLLEDMYHSITQERLRFFCDANFVRPCVPIVVKRPLPSQLTYKVQSEPIVIRIPAADPSLTIHLYGQNLVFDPPVLNFARTPEASFRVTGTALGTHNVIMCRSGAHALKYSGLPLASTITVERAFMRNTFQVAFLNHEGRKRRHMFSVEDPVLRHQWTVFLKQQVDACMAHASGSPGSPSRAAEDTAIRVLQETLMFSDTTPDTTSNGALSKLSSFGSNGSLQQSSFWIEDGAQSRGHARSKSRSQLYEQHGAGQLERDLDQSRVMSPDPVTNSMYTQTEGRLWTGRELQLQCQQNSSIPLVLSYLQVWAPDNTI
jgi:serine/arginine repetitive matrix protein 2